MIYIKDIIKEFADYKLTPINPEIKTELTLKEFINNSDLDLDDSIGKLQFHLKMGNYKELSELDSKINELIEQQIWDIEENLGIKFDYYSWDYEEFTGY